MSMNGFQGEFLRGALDVAPEGAVICEAGGDRVAIYANSAFCRLTGYDLHELLGKNLRLLQREDRDQQELDTLRESLRHGEAARALLRNTRKDGTVFVNDMQIFPLKDSNGKITHFIGYHREGGTRSRTGLGDTGIRGLPSWVREDRLTGLASRYYFEDVLKRDFALAQRDKTQIALLLFDIDQLGPYNEIFDRAGGDAVVKRVARAVAGAFRRGTDIVGRWEGASIIVLMHGTQADHVIQHATTVAHRVREQQIHHPRSQQKYVTVSGGIAIHEARSEDSAESFLKAVESAVARAKEQGRNRVIVAEEVDFS
ncbi:MAG: diguanylate cyclase [Steroidobacteraceae bacterium]|nr:diguanylate cyclase [Steroidobacteraceae bacterium]